MAVTGTYTVREIATQALRKAGVTAIDEPPTAEEIDLAVENLNRMLKAWQAHRFNLWTKTAMSVTATTSASYTLSPVRPLRILSVRWKDPSGIETPMQSMTRDEYDSLPVKTTTGRPTTWYYDRQREAAKLYVWPLPASVTTETLEITYEREIEDVVISDVIDVPGEWWEAVVYGLADRVSEDFGKANDRLTYKAKEALGLVLSDDAEDSVFFCGGY